MQRDEEGCPDPFEITPFTEYTNPLAGNQVVVLLLDQFDEKQVNKIVPAIFARNVASVILLCIEDDQRCYSSILVYDVFWSEYKFEDRGIKINVVATASAWSEAVYNTPSRNDKLGEIVIITKEKEDDISDALGESQPFADRVTVVSELGWITKDFNEAKIKCKNYAKDNKRPKLEDSKNEGYVETFLRNSFL